MQAISIYSCSFIDIRKVACESTWFSWKQHVPHIGLRRKRWREGRRSCVSKQATQYEPFLQSISIIQCSIFLSRTQKQHSLDIILSRTQKQHYFILLPFAMTRSASMLWSSRHYSLTCASILGWLAHNSHVWMGCQVTMIGRSTQVQIHCFVMKKDTTFKTAWISIMTL